MVPVYTGTGAAPRAGVTRSRPGDRQLAHFGQPEGLERAYDGPRRIDLPAPQREPRRGGVLVVVIVQPLSTGEERDPLEVGGLIGEIAVAHHVAHAVDGRIEQHVEHGVRAPCGQAPPWAEHQHEDAHSTQGRPLHAGDLVQGVILPVPGILADRARIRRLPAIEEVVAEQNGPQAVNVGAVRVARLVREVVVFAVDGGPLARHDARKQSLNSRCIRKPTAGCNSRPLCVFARCR